MTFLAELFVIQFQRLAHLAVSDCPLKRPKPLRSYLNPSAEYCRFRAGPQPLKCAPVHSLWFLRERLKQVDAAA